MTGTASTLDGESNLTFDGSLLNVNGSIRTTGNAGLPTSTGSGPVLTGIVSSPNIGKLYIGDGTGWKFHFSRRSSSIDTDLVTIIDTGFVGIGTITPTRKLDVSGDYKFVHNPSTELSVDGAYGDIVTFGSGTGFTTGGLYYYATSGTWTLADASSVAASSGLLSIALGATPSSGMLLRGYAKYAGTSYTSMTLGGIQYISGTAGSFTQTAPSITGDVVRIIGYSIDAANDILYFNPSNDWIEI